MQSLTEEVIHNQLQMVHFLHTKEPIKERLVSSHYTLLCTLSFQIATDGLLKNQTAGVLLRSSAPKRRLNKAVKKLIPLGRHAYEHT